MGKMLYSFNEVSLLAAALASELGADIEICKSWFAS